MGSLYYYRSSTSRSWNLYSTVCPLLFWGMNYANVFIDSNWLLVEYGEDPHLVESREGPRCLVLLMVRLFTYKGITELTGRLPQGYPLGRRVCDPPPEIGWYQQRFRWYACKSTLSLQHHSSDPSLFILCPRVMTSCMKQANNQAGDCIRCVVDMGFDKSEEKN